jgi:16S rRNA (cytosine1402-N4)-methyltransferase
MVYHRSVLTKKVVQYLNIKDNGIYLDLTFGGGGHSKAILESNNTIKVIAIDIDKDAIEINANRIQELFPNRFKAIWGNFSNIINLVKKEGIKSFDGIIADFGTSQFQINNKPGFSFNNDLYLDMRMSKGHTKLKAYDIVNYFSKDDLIYIFSKYGNEINSKNIAESIINYRKTIGKIKTADQLSNIIKDSYKKRYNKIDPATKVFQALRIAVNDELNNIRSMLSKVDNILNKDGRLVFISFHSLEDSLIKEFFKSNQDRFRILTPKVIKPDINEIKDNPSSRSAKLRAAEKY